MKLVYIANLRLPTEKAHGIQIMKMCEAFSNLGLEVELVVPRRLNKIKDDPFVYYKIKRNFSITKIPCLDLIAIDYILGRWSFLIQSFIFLFFVKLYLLFKKHFLIYTRDELVGLFFSHINLEIHSLRDKVKEWQIRIFNKAKVLIVLTSFIKKELISVGVDCNKIIICSDGVDLDEFNICLSKMEARKQCGLPEDKKIILYSGSFYRYGWKGVDVLLEATNFFDAGHLFVFVGGSTDDIAAIKRKRESNNILLVSHQKHSIIPVYLKAADVLVLPNTGASVISESYTSPLKLFEYMASGRPIVASELPSIGEVLNEKNALLFQAGDPQSLAESIEKVLSDDDFCNRIASQAFLDVKNYTWIKRVETIQKQIQVNQ